MPQFNAGAAKTAKIVISNPKAIATSYNGMLFMGANMMLVAEAPFSLNPGQSKEVPFAVTIPSVAGVYPVRIGAFSNNVLIPPYYLAREDVTVSIPALTLNFANPKYGATIWDATIFNLSTKTWQGGTPSGVKEVHVPEVFASPGLVFLLKIMEQQWGGSAYWLGPYLVTVPNLGAFTWSSRDGTISGGGTVVDIPAQNGKCLAVGTILSSGGGVSGVANLGVMLEYTEPIPGYYDPGQFFVGLGIQVEGRISSNLLVKGDRVIFEMTLEAYTYGGAIVYYGFIGRNFHRYSTYPAASFSGSLTLGPVIQSTGPDGEPVFSQQWDYSISGTPQFAVAIVQRYPYAGTAQARRLIGGPTSGSIVMEMHHQLEMYAHPDPSAVAWDNLTWQFENWQRVA